ncbi:MAG: type I methionyl aminopeptidase [bacterium]
MICIRSEWEIARIREAGRIVALVISELKRRTIPGISTGKLAEIAEEIIRDNGAIPTFLGYRGFPGSICTSVNSEVVHGIPSDRRLREGDIISIDVGATKDGYIGDAAVTLPVGRISRDAQRLLDVTEEALRRGIAQARPGKRLYDISYAIQSWVEDNGFSVVRDYVGHGIGRQMHEEPQIPNFGEAGKGPRIRPGMVFAIEPMVNAGGYSTEVLEDGWTVVTQDGSLSAHFEHTVVIRNNGNEILTELKDS